MDKPTEHINPPLTMFYVRAESDEGSCYDLIVHATTPQHAIEIWLRDWYGDEDEWWSADGRTWWDIDGIGVGLVAAADALVQEGLEAGAINWDIKPVASTPAAKAS